MMSKLVYVTRRERFNAAHKLWNPNWSEEQNMKTFGKCANPNWHGHNYELFITVKGVPQEDTGYCIDLKFLSDLIEERVISKMDHRNLNMDVPFLEVQMTSCELVAVAIWEQLEEPIRAMNCDLHSVRLHETENNMVEYFGGK
ncbi:MAG: 6-pyruvoyl trahydropterin synthase family protein [Flavobacteriales bacterium]